MKAISVPKINKEDYILLCLLDCIPFLVVSGMIWIAPEVHVVFWVLVFIAGIIWLALVAAGTKRHCFSVNSDEVIRVTYYNGFIRLKKESFRKSNNQIEIVHDVRFIKGGNIDIYYMFLIHSDGGRKLLCESSKLEDLEEIRQLFY